MFPLLRVLTTLLLQPTRSPHHFLTLHIITAGEMKLCFTKKDSNSPAYMTRARSEIQTIPNQIHAVLQRIWAKYSPFSERGYQVVFNDAVS